MSEYIKPQIQVIKVDFKDVITTSPVAVELEQGEFGLEDKFSF